jgi:hypothetical protein
VRSNIPVIAPAIDKATTTIAIELIFHGKVELGAGAQSLVENVITIWGVVVQSDGARSPFAVGIGNFEGSVANLECGVGDRACVGFVFREDFCAESGLDEREEIGSTFYAEVGVEILETVRPVAGASGVRGDIPVIADGILDASFAVAVVHLSRSVERFCAGLDCGIIDGVDIAGVIVESGKERLMLGAPNIAHFQHRIAEFDGSVRDFAAGFLSANGFLGVKGGLEEDEETRDAVDDEVWSDIAVTFGYSCERFGHGVALSVGEFEKRKTDSNWSRRHLHGSAAFTCRTQKRRLAAVLQNAVRLWRGLRDGYCKNLMWSVEGLRCDIS